jgi:uroporphyrinogen-III synthase
MDKGIPILSTRPLSPSLTDLAKEKNIQIDTLSFIETAPIESVEVQQEIESALILPATVVFTSKNAVDAVLLFVDDIYPDWKIYCVGNSTTMLARQFFGDGAVAATADSAAELAEIIADEHEGEHVIFFCGNQRLKDLPDILSGNGIEVDEIIVYETFAVPHKVIMEYYGILFCSPSAVDSFFSANKVPVSTVLFAIGSTTAAALHKYSSNKIIVADSPDIESIVEKAIEYFAG